MLWMRGGEEGGENEMIWGDNLLREQPNERPSLPAGRPACRPGPNNCFIAPSLLLCPIKGGRLPYGVQ